MSGIDLKLIQRLQVRFTNEWPRPSYHLPLFHQCLHFQLVSILSWKAPYLLISADEEGGTQACFVDTLTHMLEEAKSGLGLHYSPI